MMPRTPSPQPSPAYGRGSEPTDYAPFFRERDRVAKENAEMAVMEQRAAPLMWMAVAVVVALCLAAASDHVEDYLDMVAANEAMVQCLNGRTVGIGDAVLHCDVRTLTPTLSQGEREYAEVKP